MKLCLNCSDVLAACKAATDSLAKDIKIKEKILLDRAAAHYALPFWKRFKANFDGKTGPIIRLVSEAKRKKREELSIHDISWNGCEYYRLADSVKEFLDQKEFTYEWLVFSSKKLLSKIESIIFVANYGTTIYLDPMEVYLLAEFLK